MNKFVFVYYSDTTLGTFFPSNINWKVDELEAQSKEEAVQEAQEGLRELRKTGYGTIDTPHIVPVGIFQLVPTKFHGEGNEKVFTE